MLAALVIAKEPAGDQLIIGGALVIIGAALTAGLSVLGQVIQHRHQQEDERRARKRAVYESLLRFIYGYNQEIENAVRNGETVAVVQDRLHAGFLDRSVGLLLDAGPDVTSKMKDLRTVFEAYVDRFQQDGLSPDGREKLFDEMVLPTLKDTGNAMAKELKSR